MSLAIIGGVGLLWLWNRTQETSKTMKETEQLKDEEKREVTDLRKISIGISYLKGEIRSSDFLYGGEKLRLSNARIIKIHVQSNDGKKVNRKIYILCKGNVIFSGKLKYGWVDTNGILAHNATIWIEAMVKEAFKYTIYYDPFIPHQHGGKLNVVV